MASDGKVTIDIALNDKGFKSKLSKIGVTAKSVFSKGAKAIGIMSGALSTAGTVMIKTGASFEQGMAEVAAISGATGDELSALTDKAKEMGATTKFSASQSAEALKYMAMAGWESEDMLNGISGVMDLAAASGEDLGLVSDIVTDSMTAFGLSAKDAGHFADVLAKASSKSNTNVAMMGETFKYVAPVAGSMGYNIEDTAVAIGLMANAGIKGSQAGTSLRAMFTRLVKPTKEVDTALQELGYETDSYNEAIETSTGEMKPLSEVLADLRERFSGLTDSEKANTAAKIAGQEAMSGLLAIVNASNEDFNKLTKEISNSEGAAADMAKTMSDTLHGAILENKSALEALSISFYDTFKDKAKLGIQAITGELRTLEQALRTDGVNGLIAATGELITKGLTFAAARIPEVIELTGQFLQSIINSIVENQESLLESAVQIVLTLMEGIVSATPLLLDTVAELILCLADYISQHSEEIVDKGIELTVKLIEGIVKAIPKLAEAVLKVITALVREIIKNFPKIIKAGSETVVNFINGILDALPDLVDTALDLVGTIWDTIKNTDWVELGKSLMRSIINGIKSMFSNLWDTAKEIGSGIWDRVSGIFGGSGGRSHSSNSYSDRPHNSRNIANDNSVNVNMNYYSSSSSYQDAQRMSKDLGRLTQKEMRMRGINAE